MLNTGTINLDNIYNLDKYKKQNIESNINLLFIESILLSIPTHPINLCFESTLHYKELYYIIDGVKRIQTIKDYVNGVFNIGSSIYFPNLTNKYFQELPGFIQAKIESFNITAHIIQPGTPNHIKLDLINRLS